MSQIQLPGGGVFDLPGTGYSYQFPDGGVLSESVTDAPVIPTTATCSYAVDFRRRNGGGLVVSRGLIPSVLNPPTVVDVPLAPLVLTGVGPSAESGVFVVMPLAVLELEGEVPFALVPSSLVIMPVGNLIFSGYPPVMTDAVSVHQLIKVKHTNDLRFLGINPIVEVSNN